MAEKNSMEELFTEISNYDKSKYDKAKEKELIEKILKLNPSQTIQRGDVIDLYIRLFDSMYNKREGKRSSFKDVWLNAKNEKLAYEKIEKLIKSGDKLSKRSVMKGYITKIDEHMQEYNEFAKYKEANENKQIEEMKKQAREIQKKYKLTRFFEIAVEQNKRTEKAKTKMKAWRMQQEKKLKAKEKIKELAEKKYKRNIAGGMEKLGAQLGGQSNKFYSADILGILNNLLTKKNEKNEPLLDDYNAGKTIKIIRALSKAKMPSKLHQWIKKGRELDSAIEEVTGMLKCVDDYKKTPTNANLKIYADRYTPVTVELTAINTYLKNCKDKLNLLVNQNKEGENISVDIDLETSKKISKEFGGIDTENPTLNESVSCLFKGEPNLNDFQQKPGSCFCWISNGLASILQSEKGKQKIKDCFPEKYSPGAQTVKVKLHDPVNSKIIYKIDVPTKNLIGNTDRLVRCIGGVGWPACLAYALTVVLDQKAENWSPFHGLDMSGDTKMVYATVLGNVKQGEYTLDLEGKTDGTKIDEYVKFGKIFSQDKDKVWTFAVPHGENDWHAVTLVELKWTGNYTLDQKESYGISDANVESKMMLRYYDMELPTCTDTYSRSYGKKLMKNWTLLSKIQERQAKGLSKEKQGKSHKFHFDYVEIK